MIDEDIKLTYTPSDEPYLGREPLCRFDQMICCCLELNSIVAPKTHGIALSSSQQMACQVIPQSISIALSVRELVRQGYLFGAHVLKRSLIERVMILLYLHNFPEKISLWNEGWNHKKAPSLAKMFEDISSVEEGSEVLKGYELTASLNSLVHGKPDSARWSSIVVGDEKFGHASSKILNNPPLCDELCDDIFPWLTIVSSMICAYFPELLEDNAKSTIPNPVDM